MSTDTQPDLFNVPITRAEVLGKPKKPKRTGHAAPPGSGPAGKRCGQCSSYCVKHMGGAYRKCLLVRAHWTNGPGSDIRAKDPACHYFTEQQEPAATIHSKH